MNADVVFAILLVTFGTRNDQGDCDIFVAYLRHGCTVGFRRQCLPGQRKELLELQLQVERHGIRYIIAQRVHMPTTHAAAMSSALSAAASMNERERKDSKGSGEGRGERILSTPKLNFSPWTWRWERGWPLRV